MCFVIIHRVRESVCVVIEVQCIYSVMIIKEVVLFTIRLLTFYSFPHTCNNIMHVAIHVHLLYCTITRDCPNNHCVHPTMINYSSHTSLKLQLVYVQCMCCMYISYC